MKTVSKYQFTDIHIEEDNNHIKVVQSYIQASWKIQVLILDIHTYTQLSNSVIIAHIFK